MPKRDLKKELSQLSSLKHEVQMLDDQLSRLYDKRIDVNAGAKTDSVKGSMLCEPYVVHNIPVVGLSDEALGVKTAIRSDIADIKSRLKKRQADCVKEYMRLTEFIAGVSDSRMRQILTWKYIYGLHWPEIAAKIGSDVSIDSVKKAHERFLNKF